MSALKKKKSGTPQPETKKKTPSAARRESSSAPSPAAAPSQPKIPFQLPPEFAEDPDRFEFWTIRMPDSIPLQDLAGCQLSSDSPTPDESKFTSSSSNDKNKTTYALHFGHPTENESVRMLLPKSQLGITEDSEDEDEEEAELNKHLMVPLPKGFSRHINVLEYHEPRSEHDLAPHPDQAPEVSSSTIRRVAYSHVPQKTGLKRRWEPIGCNASTGVLQKNSNASRGRSHSQSIEEDSKMSATPERKKKHAEKHVQVKQETITPPAKRNAGVKEETSQDKHGKTSSDANKRKAAEISIDDDSIKLEEGVEGVVALKQEPSENGNHIKIEEKSPKKAKKEAKEAKKEAKRAKKEAKKARKSI